MQSPEMERPSYMGHKERFLAQKTQIDALSQKSSDMSG